jgi:hypothetical protein
VIDILRFKLIQAFQPGYRNQFDQVLYHRSMVISHSLSFVIDIQGFEARRVLRGYTCWAMVCITAA